MTNRTHILTILLLTSLVNLLAATVRADDGPIVGPVFNIHREFLDDPMMASYSHGIDRREIMRDPDIDIVSVGLRFSGRAFSDAEGSKIQGQDYFEIGAFSGNSAALKEGLVTETGIYVGVGRNIGWIDLAFRYSRSTGNFKLENGDVGISGLGSFARYSMDLKLDHFLSPYLSIANHSVIVHNDDWVVEGDDISIGAFNFENSVTWSIGLEIDLSKLSR